MTKLRPPEDLFTTWEEYPSWIGPDAGYMAFEACGMVGLARYDGWTIEFLAVASTYPGTGQFRKLMEECKARFPSIVLWDVLNPFLEATLVRYGFVACSGIEGNEQITGMVWRK